MEKVQSKPNPGVNRNLLLVVILAGAFVVILNQSLLNTALPHIMKDLSISPNTAQWLATGFILVMGVLIPVTPLLIAKFSTKTLFIVAMTFFAIGSLIGALAPNFETLLIARILQACGAGIMIPLIQTILLLMFPVEKRGLAMGAFGMVAAFAPAIGPTLSGWVVDVYSWRVLFYMVLPVVILVIVTAIFMLKKESTETNPKIDVLSIILSTSGFSGLLYGFSSIGDKGWSSSEVIITLSVGVISLILFIWRQLVMEKPILELRVFKNRTFALSVVIGAIVMMTMIGVQLLLPIFLQNARGYTALESGVFLLPGAVIMGVMTLVSGKIFDKIGARPLAITGLIIVTTMLYFFSNLTATTSYTYMVVINSILMFGISLVVMPVMTAGLNQLPDHLISHGAAVNNTLRTVASSIGAAMLITIMTNRAKEVAQEQLSNPLVHGVAASFTFITFTALAALILSFFIKAPKKVKKEG